MVVCTSKGNVENCLVINIIIIGKNFGNNDDRRPKQRF